MVTSQTRLFGACLCITDRRTIKVVNLHGQNHLLFKVGKNNQSYFIYNTSGDGYIHCSGPFHKQSYIRSYDNRILRLVSIVTNTLIRRELGLCTMLYMNVYDCSRNWPHDLSVYESSGREMCNTCGVFFILLFFDFR